MVQSDDLRFQLGFSGRQREHGLEAALRPPTGWGGAGTRGQGRVGDRSRGGSQEAKVPTGNAV